MLPLKSGSLSVLNDYFRSKCILKNNCTESLQTFLNKYFKNLGIICFNKKKIFFIQIIILNTLIIKSHDS